MASTPATPVAADRLIALIIGKVQTSNSHKLLKTFQRRRFSFYMNEPLFVEDAADRDSSLNLSLFLVPGGDSDPLSSVW